MSILGRAGGLAFGSMEARKGPSDPKKGREPGPGAYDGAEGDTNSGSKRVRKVVPPSSFFRSKVPKAGRLVSAAIIAAIIAAVRMSWWLSIRKMAK